MQIISDILIVILVLLCTALFIETVSAEQRAKQYQLDLQHIIEMEQVRRC